VSAEYKQAASRQTMGGLPLGPGGRRRHFGGALDDLEKTFWRGLNLAQDH
jgi:hypothetical protein